MAQTNYTPIILYNSGTTTNAPSASNLASGELAINYTDGKLFYKDNSSAIQVIAWKTTPTTAGGTGLTSYTAGDLPYYASGSALSKLAIGTANYVLTSSGTAPQYVAQSTLSVGTATNATNTAITDNTSSSATWYPTIVSNTTGNLPQNTSSTQLSFVPSTGVLTATSFNGNLDGSKITGSRSISNSVLPAGTILQVASSTITSQVTTTSSSLTSTSHTVSITPKSATSKIFVIATGSGGTSLGSSSAFYTVLRNGTTNLSTGTAIGVAGDIYTPGATASVGGIAMSFYDSPATTSSTTYTVYFGNSTSGVTTSWGSAAGAPSSSSATITVMEIAQ